MKYVIVWSKQDKQTDNKNKWPIIALWKTTFTRGMYMA